MDMALKQQLHQKQVQRLILAPALQQAIKLLPLTNLELIEIIDQELSENPLLEVKEESAENNEDLEKGAKDSSEPGAVEGPVDEESDLARALGLDGKDDDRDIQKYFQEYFDDGFRTYSQEKKEAPVLENFISN